MTKEEKIKEAWGGAYGGDIFENGWKPINSVYISDTLDVDYSECRTMARPKSLRGIEHNNGWNILKGIKNEIQHDGDIWIINRNGNIELWLQYQYLPIGYATHWKPVIKPKPPVY